MYMKFEYCIFESLGNSIKGKVTVFKLYFFSRNFSYMDEENYLNDDDNMHTIPCIPSICNAKNDG